MRNLKDCNEDGYGLIFNKLPKTSGEAKVIGTKYFYTGKSCSHGHDSPRYVKGGSCVYCTRSHNAFKNNKLETSINSRAIANLKRLEANKNGDRTYVPFRPCKHGHYERFVASNNCIQCSKDADIRQKDCLRYRRIKKFYGITKNCFLKMVEDQNSCCKICEEKIQDHSKFHIDHCHTTGNVRSLLCGKCNQGIGLLLHNPCLIRKAAMYCEKNK